SAIHLETPWEAPGGFLLAKSGFSRPYLLTLNLIPCLKTVQPLVCLHYFQAFKFGPAIRGNWFHFINQLLNFFFPDGIFFAVKAGTARQVIC
ncbi:MAG: hypothetical protein ACE5G9_09245, partial [Nitrospinales bacterium]